MTLPEFNSIIESLQIIQTRLTLHLPQRWRLYYQNDQQIPRGSLIMGARGIGKTSWVLKTAHEQNMFYASCDNPVFQTLDPLKFADAVFINGYEGIVFDEVHYLESWKRVLKSIYDAHPKKSIWALDSNSAALKSGNADLSRRFLVNSLPYLSFREYLFIKHNLSFPKLDAFNPNAKTISSILSEGPILKYFRDYLREGFRPIFLEGQYAERLQQTIDKTLYDDIPFIVKNLGENHRRLMAAIVGYLATSAIPTLNIDSLCRNWAVGKEKLYEILHALESVGLIHIVRVARDHKTYSKGAKILFQDPTLYTLYTRDLGNVREAFCVTMLKSSGKHVHAASNETDADLKVDNALVEIGGRSKSRKKSDYVIRDDIEIPVNNAIPLWTLGMMY